MGKRILHVSDLPVDTRARELAREFERYGPIVRCDVPIPRRDARTAYAFVEYEDSRDADDAYRRLHGKRFHGGSIRIEWAKRGPDRDRDRRRNGVRRGDDDVIRRGRGLLRSPSATPRNEGDENDRRRDRSRSPSRSRSPVNENTNRSRSRSPSRSPSRSRSRSPAPRSPITSYSPKMSDLDDI